MNKIIIVSILLMSLTTVASAQLKIGYILSERIRSEYEEFKEAESQLQLEYRKVQFEFDQRVKKLDSLKQDYEVKRLMSLDKGESIKQEIDQTEKQIQTYQAEKVGPQGELMRKQAQMEYDILGKVKKAVIIGVGAAQGLGAQLAKRFASEGLHVFIASRRQSSLEALKIDYGLIVIY